MSNDMSNYADKLLDILFEINALQNYNNRTQLLRHLPSTPVGYIERYNSPSADLNNIVTTVHSWGQLIDTGEWALVIVTRNALRFVRGVSQGRKLEAMLASLETLPSDTDIPLSISEIVVGSDERLPISFLERGLRASRSVARIWIPRIFSGEPKNSALGTGWLITPDLLMTNYHVVSARGAFENPINDDDFQAQVEQAKVWFDYQDWDKVYREYRFDEILHINPVLDYALLRLKKHSVDETATPVSKWGYLLVPKQIALLSKGERLNIIQHPQGGPKRLAIRSNFYVESPVSSVSRFHYLTDTEPGSSGSPVLNDDWQVVGLHAAAVSVPETQYKGEVIKYNNQGISMKAIIDDLPIKIYDMIAPSQNWS